MAKKYTADIIEATSITGSLLGTATLASALVPGNKTVEGDLTVTGKITAEEFHTEYVSSSIVYTSGSTKFGDSSDDVMSVTGSLQVQGSITGSLFGTASYAMFAATPTVQGVQGIQGIAGDLGGQGAQGIQGIQGTAGYVGSDGAQGIQGITGIQGTQGIQGVGGSIGGQGTQGTQGTTGQTGAQGIQGTTGQTGAQGSTGNQGTTGAQGTTGTQGIQGIQGVQGTNAGITSYTNASDNRVITSVSSTTINAEANLTFDGSQLVLSGTGVANTPTYRINTSTNASFIHTQENFAANVTAGGRPVIFIGKSGTTKNAGGIGYYWAGDASNSNFITLGHWGNDDLFRIYGDGSVVATTNLQAPIFYDYNNTSYYIDPASTSNLNLLTTANAATIGGILSIGNSTNTKIKWGGNTTPTLGFPFTATANALWLEVNNGDTGGVVIDDDGVTVYGAGDNGYVFRVIDEDVYQGNSNVDASTTFYVAQGANGGGYMRGILNVTDYLTAGNSARAPIFYDSNDTAYYGDFNSTSDSAVRQRGGTLHGPNPTWGAYLLVGGDGRQNYTNSTTVASVCASNGNLHLDAASGYQTYINFYDGDVVNFGNGASNTVSTINTDGSHRPQIIYDYNNTGYYIDPSSSSNVYAFTTSALTTLVNQGGGNYNESLRLPRSNGGYVCVAMACNTSGAGSISGQFNMIVYPSSTNSGGFTIRANDIDAFSISTGALVSTYSTFTAGGDVVAYSDRRVKENIETIDNALEKVKALRGVTYNRTDREDTSQKVGVIAQEVQEVLPQVVHEQENGMLGVSYGNIAAVLIEAIKEQQTQIENQQSQIDELKSLVKQLLG